MFFNLSILTFASFLLDEVSACLAVTNDYIWLNKSVSVPYFWFRPDPVLAQLKKLVLVHP
jgi:hypothetical protein